MFPLIEVAVKEYGVAAYHMMENYDYDYFTFFLKAAKKREKDAEKATKTK